MALNKNQKKFFEEAIAYFGVTSRDIKYKALVDFAKDKDLILPVSALKELCSIEDKRGRYNLLASGAVNYASVTKVFDTPEADDTNVDDDTDGGDVIVETSSFVEPANKSAAVKSRGGLMFVVLSDDLFPVSLRRTIKGAYLDAKNLLGGKGVTPIEEVAKHLKKNEDATTVISSDNGIQIYIHAMEILP